MNRKRYIMLIIALILCGPTHRLCTMDSISQMLFNWWNSGYSEQEKEYIEIIKKLESIEPDNQLEVAVAQYSPSDLLFLKEFLQKSNLANTYPRVANEINAQLIITEGQQEELLKEQIESLYDMVKRGDFSILINLEPSMRERYINYIKKFREDYDSKSAYEELYKLLEIKQKARPIAVEGYYPTTIETSLKTSQHLPIITHIINLNNLELAGPKCTVTKNAHLDIDDYARLINQSGDLPENLNALSKEITFETLCSPLIVQRQVQNECGLMSIYNALQCYNLLNKKIDRATFENNLKSFNLNDWMAKVESCPIDTNDIINIMAQTAPEIGKNQYTIIPTIVNENGFLNYSPLKNKSVVMLHNGDIEANFDQDVSLLHAIENIHNDNIPTYTHIFFLNNLQIGEQGASMRHWIPVVLHKENDQLYLYTMNSQSVFREDLIDPYDKVVDLEALARIVEKDNSWLHALVELLSINPEALRRAITIASTINPDDYNHNYIPDILEALMGDNSPLADEIRAMLTPR